MIDNSAVYLDTSALAKWYLSESNSEQVSAYIVGLDVAVVITLTKTEMRCLLARRKRMHALNANVEAQIYATFLDDISQGHLLALKVEDKHLESSGQPLCPPPNIPTEVMFTVPPRATLIVGSRRLFIRSKATTSLDNGHGNSMTERNQLGIPLPGGTGSDCTRRISS